MPDPIPTAPVAAVPDPNAPPAPPSSAPKEPEKAFVTIEQLAELNNRLDGMSGALRGLVAAKDTPPVPTAPTTPPSKSPATPPATAEAELELKRRVDALEEDKVKVRNSAIRNHMREKAIAAGVPTDRVAHLVKIHGMDLDGRLQLSDDLETVSVEATSPLDQALSYEKHLETFLQGDMGQMFKPPNAGAGAPGMAGNPNIGADGRHKFSSMTYEQIMAQPGSMEYMQSNKAEFQAKKQAALAKKKGS